MGASGEPDEPVKGATLRREDCELDPNDFWFRLYFGLVWVVFPVVIGGIFLSSSDLHTGTCLLSDNLKFKDGDCHFPDSLIVSGLAGRPFTTFTEELPRENKGTADCVYLLNATVDCGWGSDPSKTIRSEKVKSQVNWAKGVGISMIVLSVFNLLLTGSIYVRCRNRVEEAIHFEAYDKNSTIQVGWMWDDFSANHVFYGLLIVLLGFGIYVAVYTLIGGLTNWVAATLTLAVVQPFLICCLWFGLNWYHFDEEYFSKGTTRHRWSDVERCVEEDDPHGWHGDIRGLTVKWKGIHSEEYFVITGPPKEYFCRTLKLITGVEAVRSPEEVRTLL